MIPSVPTVVSFAREHVPSSQKLVNATVVEIAAVPAGLPQAPLDVD